MAGQAATLGVKPVTPTRDGLTGRGKTRIRGCCGCLHRRSDARVLANSGISESSGSSRVLANSGSTVFPARRCVCACACSCGGVDGGVLRKAAAGQAAALGVRPIAPMKDGLTGHGRTRIRMCNRAGRLGLYCTRRGPAGLSVHLDCRLVLIERRAVLPG